MKRIGYERSIDRFLATLDIDTLPAGRILDAGCGTGFLGLHFLQRWPHAELHATDLEPNFLRTTLANAERRGLPADRIRTSVSDISAPKQGTALDGTRRTLVDSSYNLICLGAVVGYASDTEMCLRQLMQLLAPGGTLLNLEMNESLTGRFVSWRYQYQNISLARIEQVIREEGGEMTPATLGLRHFPACLTRIPLVARKTIR
ncbi:MAG: class I SAM-dependent methyltransferase [Planctomycetota bacterium]|nr:class I SAM-dependent methyltransferase [Planctomycetota bacterium]